MLMGPFFAAWAVLAQQDLRVSTNASNERARSRGVKPELEADRLACRRRMPRLAAEQRRLLFAGCRGCPSRQRRGLLRPDGRRLGAHRARERADAVCARQRRGSEPTRTTRRPQSSDWRDPRFDDLGSDARRRGQVGSQGTLLTDDTAQLKNGESERPKSRRPRPGWGSVTSCPRRP